MSGLVGIFRLDTRPLDPRTLEAMMARIAYRGPDGKSAFIDERIGLGHTLLATTPQEHRSGAPFSIDSRYHIVADACLYNREELAEKLTGFGSGRLDATPDCALILAAYKKWGVSCPDHLVGDFSFAIWDSVARQLLLARDPMGIRQLYYSRHGNTLLFSTDVSAIRAALPAVPELNLGLIEQVLLNNPGRWASETGFRDILKLEAGHRLLARDRIQVERYYDLSRVAELKYRSDADYIEHFDEVFTRAVDRRLRANSQVGLVVSGGVDSSTVAATVKKLNQHQPPANLPVLYSYAGENARCCDDWTYLQQLIAACPGWRASLVDGDALWALKQTAAETHYHPDEPEADLTPHGWIDIAHRAKREGTRVLLTGHGGDQVMCGDAYSSPYLIQRLRLSGIPSEWRYFRQESGLSSLGLLKEGIVEPLAKEMLPTRIRSLLKRQLMRRRQPRWIRAQVDLQGEGRLDGLLRASGAIQRHGVHVALDGYYQRTFSVFDQAFGLHHAEHRYPYYDTRVIELVLGLPTRLFFRRGQTKWLLRQITRDWLPETLRNRSTYCTNQEWIDRGWRQHERSRIEDRLARSRLVELGLVDQDGLKHAWKRFWSGDDSELWHLSAWINIESWLGGL